MDAAAPYIVQGSKDRKSYVLQPRIIELSILQGLMRTFRAVCWSSTVVKLDILAALRFAQIFVILRQQALRGEAEEDEFSDEAQLYSIAQGFEAISFKDMGSAYATMNVAFINFPQWLPEVRTEHDVEQALTLLQEHLQIIQRIRNSKGEEGSEEYELLRLYRDFLSGPDLRPFWKFTTAYSSYLISQREGEKTPQRWIRQLSITGLENLLKMNNAYKGGKLTEITNDPGSASFSMNMKLKRRAKRKNLLQDWAANSQWKTAATTVCVLKLTRTAFKQFLT